MLLRNKQEMYFLFISVLRFCSVCARGRWVCTKNICDSVCKAVGNHFSTFDGKNFDFDGKCNYILSRSEGMQDIAFEVQLITTCT